MLTGDSAAYVAEFAAEIVLAGEGMIFKDRAADAQHVGRPVRADKVADVGTSGEEIRVIGPRAVAITANFQYTKTDSAGKPVKVTGVWSGVLGVKAGEPSSCSSICQDQHPPSDPEAVMRTWLILVLAWRTGRWGSTAAQQRHTSTRGRPLPPEASCGIG